MTIFGNIDLKIFHAVHDIAGRSIFLDAIGYSAAIYLIILMALGVVVFSASHLAGKRIAWRAICASIIVFFYNAAIGLVIKQARPPLVTEANPLYWPTWTDKSFPSDHAGISFAVAWIIFRASPKTGKFFLILATIVALGRVYIGVHFPSDVVFGSLFGILCAEAVIQVDSWYMKRKHPSRSN